VKLHTNTDNFHLLVNFIWSCKTF